MAEHLNHVPFHLFWKLPIELQCEIWRHALGSCQAPRVMDLRIRLAGVVGWEFDDMMHAFRDLFIEESSDTKGDTTKGQVVEATNPRVHTNLRIRSVSGPPAAMLSCKMAFEVGLQQCKAFGIPGIEPETVFNLETDIAYFRRDDLHRARPQLSEITQYLDDAHCPWYPYLEHLVTDIEELGCPDFTRLRNLAIYVSTLKILSDDEDRDEKIEPLLAELVVLFGGLKQLSLVVADPCFDNTETNKHSVVNYPLVLIGGEPTAEHLRQHAVLRQNDSARLSQLSSDYRRAQIDLAELKACVDELDDERGSHTSLPEVQLKVALPKSGRSEAQKEVERYLTTPN